MTGADLAPFWLSLRVAGLATGLVVVLGLPVAWGLARWRFRGQGLVLGLLMLPLVLPPTVVGFGLLAVLGRRGIVGHWLESGLGVVVVFRPAAAVIAAAVMAFPLFLVSARTALLGVDPAYEDAARLLGRGEVGVFLSITLPLSIRGIAAGVVLAFARALGEFGATLMLAGSIPGRTRTAPLAIYDAVLMDRPGLAAGLSALLGLAALGAVALANAAQRPGPAG